MGARSNPHSPMQRDTADTEHTCERTHTVTPSQSTEPGKARRLSCEQRDYAGQSWTAWTEDRWNTVSSCTGTGNEGLQGSIILCVCPNKEQHYSTQATCCPPQDFIAVVFLSGLVTHQSLFPSLLRGCCYLLQTTLFLKNLSEFY